MAKSTTAVIHGFPKFIIFVDLNPEDPDHIG
jgi:hypothetical protein